MIEEQKNEYIKQQMLNSRENLILYMTQITRSLSEKYQKISHFVNSATKKNNIEQVNQLAPSKEALKAVLFVVENLNKMINDKKPITDIYKEIAVLDSKIKEVKNMQLNQEIRQIIERVEELITPFVKIQKSLIENEEQLQRNKETIENKVVEEEQINKNEEKIKIEEIQIQQDIEGIKKQMADLKGNLSIYMNDLIRKLDNEYKNLKSSIDTATKKNNIERINELQPIQNRLKAIIEIVRQINRMINEKQPITDIYKGVVLLDSKIKEVKYSTLTNDAKNIIEQAEQILSGYVLMGKKLIEKEEQLQKNKEVNENKIVQPEPKKQEEIRPQEKNVEKEPKTMSNKEIEEEIIRLIKLDDSGREFLSPKQVTELREREEALEDELERRKQEKNGKKDPKTMTDKEIEEEIIRLIKLDDSGREFLSPKQVIELREREEALEDELEQRKQEKNEKKDPKTMTDKEIEEEIIRLIKLDDSGREFLSPKQVIELREREEALEDELDRRQGREPIQKNEEIIKENTPPKKKFGLMTKIKSVIKPILETVSRMASKLNFLNFKKNDVSEYENTEEVNLENTGRSR